MVLHDSKDQFYSELKNKIENEDITSEEFVRFIRSFDSLDNSDFYELCSKFADIGLNAPKQADPVTCDVKAVFQFSDCNRAKAAFKEFTVIHHLLDIDGLLEAVRQMHHMAKAWDDTRCKGGIVLPKDYDEKPGFGGKYYNFCELPDDIWRNMADDIRKELKAR